MKTIPIDLSSVLNALGIVTHSGWVRGPDVEAPPSYRIAQMCLCEFYQVFLTPVTLRDREIMAGQCPLCKVIHWADWVSKEEASSHGNVRTSRRRSLPSGRP